MLFTVPSRRQLVAGQAKAPGLRIIHMDSTFASATVLTGICPRGGMCLAQGHIVANLILRLVLE